MIFMKRMWQRMSLDELKVMISMADKTRLRMAAYGQGKYPLLFPDEILLNPHIHL